MIINVKHISRSSFNRINFCLTSESPTKDTHAYISIFGTDREELPAPKINHSIWYDGIQLQFDDADYDDSIRKLKAISKKQANDIVQFTTKLHEISLPLTLIVHCYAGISRSAAVAKFVNENFDLGLPAYQGLGLFNSTVFRALNDVFHGSLREQYGATD